MNPPQQAIGYPLKMEGILDLKPWGGTRLARFGKALPAEPIGESLESASESRVTNGPLVGRALGDLARTMPGPLLGRRGEMVSGSFQDFPLLIKIIDAHANLSVQVHPDDSHAPAGKRGKTEAWLILHAEPGASIVAGIDGNLEIDRIREQIDIQPVSTGDVFFIPAGTIHAIGAGVLLYEVQQASDVTFRLYDWGRHREMHVEDGLRASNVSQRVRRVGPLRIDGTREVLVACRHFALERWTNRNLLELPARPDAFRVLTVLEGEMSVLDVVAGAGDTLVLPADLPACAIVGAGVVLVAYIPDIAADVVEPLLAFGHSMSAIDALGILS